MDPQRIFPSAKFFQPTTVGEPIRSVVTASEHAVVVAWQIEPGQEIPAHFHPHGQDTWTILSGKGEYYLDRSGTTRSIETGDVVVAPTGSIHGVFNHGSEPLIFISIVAPGEAGYERLDEFTR
jgi:quercetin dioxygenase-like cupin family protein